MQPSISRSGIKDQRLSNLNCLANEIIIERRIGRSASFSIMSAKGKKLGHKREDLDIILEALSINAANPIAVMTQVSIPLHPECPVNGVIGQQTEGASSLVFLKLML